MSEPRLFEDEALSVGQIFRRSKNALARDFRGPVWVKGEVKNVRDFRGMLYLTLIEPGDFTDGSDLSVDVACRPRPRSVMTAQLKAAGIELAAGMQVRVQGSVTLSKFSKLQIDMISIDTQALIGEQAAEKRRLYEALSNEDLIQANARIAMGPVPLRVGLVSSEGSEGFNDFLGQLERSSYRFDVHFAHSSVQGPAAPASIARAIASLQNDELDVIAVVRGGGGELDAFDKEVVARSIATSLIPVWTGIGHTGDRSVADAVAHTSFITPTECGQGLVRAVRDFAESVTGHLHRLRRLTERKLENEARHVGSIGKHLTSATTSALTGAHTALHRQSERARRCADRDLALATLALSGYRKDVLRGSVVVQSEAAELLRVRAGQLMAGIQRRIREAEGEARVRRAQLASIDPNVQLRRGFSITRRKDGSLLRNISELVAGETILTSLAGGSASSTVDEVNAEEGR